MPPKKQGDRIADLEMKLEMVLKKLELEAPPEIEHSEEKEEADDKTVDDENAKKEPHLKEKQTPKRRERRSRSSAPSITDDEDDYTPRNQRRYRDRARSHTPSSRRPFSTKEVLQDHGMQTRAQQILDLLNPQLPPGKVYDPYSNRTARFAMPRMFLNMTAQKAVKSLKHPDDLSLPQFIEGYTRMIEAEGSYDDKRSMISHLADVAVLLQDFPWEVVREWTNTIISSIGQGVFKWSDSQRIEKEKIIKLMGATGSVKTLGAQGRNACVAFNAAKCNEEESHGCDNLHICSFCLAVFSAEHDHPVLVCHKRFSYKKNRDRAEYQRSDRYDRHEKYDSGNRAYSEAPYNQTKGRGSYNNREQFHRQPSQQLQYTRPEQKFWNQPPPTISEPKNW